MASTDGPSEIHVVEPACLANDQTATTPSSDSSFDDAYKQQPAETKEVDDMIVGQGTEVSDDYAMTFDSDGEEGADSQDKPETKVEEPDVTLPTAIPVNNSSPSISIEPESSLIDVPQNGQNAKPTQTNSSSLPAVVDASSAQSNSPVTQAPVPESHSSHQYDSIANGDVDIQALLDNIVAKGEREEAASVHSPSSQNTSHSRLGLPAHSSLPPRPQASQPYPHNDDMQKYHAGPPGVSNTYRPPGGAPPSMGVSISSGGYGGLPPPPSPFRQPSQPIASPITPSYSQLSRPNGQGHAKSDSHDDAGDFDRRWGPDVQAKYDAFLTQERQYVTEGLWDRFPMGSRLFIGNLPSEKVTKRDLFHVFHKYGDLAQVSIKQAYGFIQYHTSKPCYEALRAEQGAEVRGRKMHLEISKPQKNSRQAQPQQASVRRDRSPDRARDNMQNRGGRRQNNNNGGHQRNGGDSYDGRSDMRDEYDRPSRMRDDYRHPRSPTPPRGGFRGRDDYDRGRDAYGGRDNRRSRSRSPYGNRDNLRYRERSPSPRRGSSLDDELQIPRRDPINVPDVQIIVMEAVDRAFVTWVENEFLNRGIKSEVMYLSPRLSVDVVIQRQIIEGVHAVSQLNMRAQNSAKISIQVFDRSTGAHNVQWAEYQDLEPRIAAELVIVAKQKILAPPPATIPQYTQPKYAPQPQYAPQQPYQQPAAAPPNLARMLGNVDPNVLQNILGSLQNNQQHQNAPAVATNSTVDLAKLLGGLQQQQPSYAPQALASEPYAQYNPQTQQQQPQQSAQQVQNIMANLAKFRQ